MPKNGSPPQRDIVTASEIGDFVFCGESWRLSALGTKPTAAIQAARTEGTQHHASLTITETAATRSIHRGRGLVAIGLAALAILAVLWLAFR